MGHGKVMDRSDCVVLREEAGSIQRSLEQVSIQEVHRWTTRPHVLLGGRDDQQCL